MATALRREPDPHATALVTGASGQDGLLLTARLVAEGFSVHAVTRDRRGFGGLEPDLAERVYAHELDITDAEGMRRVVADTQPAELYNLAGLSSVAKSFERPEEAWDTNAGAVAHLLESVRCESPSTRVYQASSSEMFGWIPGGSVVHREDTPLFPQSPYASAKAAAHLLCATYRTAYGIRVACGILFNHESRRRGPAFLTRKVTDHVRRLVLSDDPTGGSPLAVGNLKARRDWGYAPDYVDGMCRILRQVRVRAEVAGTEPEADQSTNYRDYVLGTGTSHAVWELIDRSFALAGFDLDWHLDSKNPAAWHADFRGTHSQAVIVDRSFLRPSDPLSIESDPGLARRELGWSPRAGLEAFLRDMLDLTPA